MTAQPSLFGPPASPGGVRWHERRGPDGTTRAPWDALSGVLGSLNEADLTHARWEADRLLADDGVTYQAVDNPSRAWRLDPIPLPIGEDEWATIEAGVKQRAEILSLVLADIYGPQELIRAGHLPPEVIYAHPGYLRALHDIRNPGHRQLVTCATDIVRDGQGRWRPIADRTQSPSGAGYALANRSVMARVLTEEQRDAQVLRLAPYIRALRSGLRRLAPKDVDNPRVVVLTSGADGETSYEHAALASALGVPLVEGSDLAVRQGHLMLRSLDHLEPIDVVLRRVDAEWCDPLELRPGSTLGAPAFVEASRRGNLGVANPLGAGVLENAGLLAHLPQLSQHLLGQTLRLEPARTWWCGDPAQRAFVLENLDELMIKPIVRGHPHRAGWQLTNEQRRTLVAQIEARPHWWVGQEALPASLVPTLGLGGEVTDRAAVLRTFVVADEDGYVAMPGGLTRVDSPDLLVITNATGAWSKDTWIVSGAEEPTTGYWFQDGPLIVADEPDAALSVRAADNLVWLGRYAERAESLVRLLRVIDDRRTDFGGATGAAGVATVDVLLQAITAVTTTWPGFVGKDGPARRQEPDAELTSLVLDAGRTGSLAQCVHRLLAAAANVRDRLSSDTWPVTNALQREVLTDRPAIVDQHGVTTRGGLGRVLTGLLALQGLGSESLERDPTWSFMEVGRRLERSLQVVGLLQATVTRQRPHDVDSLVWESVLMTAESIITYRRRYRSRAQLPTVLDLLLKDARNPRSLAWQLDRLVEALRLLPDHPGAGQVSALEQTALDTITALRLADTVGLSQATPDGDRAELRALFTHLTAQLHATGDLLFTTSLAPQAPLRSTLSPSAPTATLPNTGVAL